MLTTATLGMTSYGLYSLLAGLVDLVGDSQLEVLANIGAIVLGAMLVLAGLLIRVGLPGSLALALAALFGLQSLALHNAGHLYGQVAAEPQIARALFALLLVGLAYFGRVEDGDLQESEAKKQKSEET
ncbi:MAG: hypothetical protein CL477_06510 [Acidobacteria bacterium]|jgi:hypothetical protein|nr:hypothetical protein [Acidobacteriota bacterium]MDP7338527.1 hypothetical protein [Vicinamibacterales bacterium]MDP7480180.1 hypothetical protein [Vicinamibacterales bacterium]MDP7693630.1 hypothetical protein [Vicinamibacterales bacterium]HJN43580.1 hypothetical protein [Vicinamibacterales bacterium]|tara:strand:- start:236 stop:619 length:384 start_codon:yes stop_codon:yes gene_type:complete